MEGGGSVQGLGLWRWLAWIVIKPPMFLLTRRTWSGGQHLPRQGGLILVVNHISEFDPPVIAHFVYDAGRWPQFLAKASLFRIPVMGWLLRRLKQIPVQRGTATAAQALDDAAAALKAGDAVIIYPEGTTPKEGDLWPGRGKTGVARLYLATGAPVVPIVSWGPQRLFDPRTSKLRLRPRTPIAVAAGPPLDLAKWDGIEATAANLAALTEEIMATLRTMIGELRGEPVPESTVERQP
jgi:1-acyl-sn-glycerol-3-phosphate acyltransferase